MGRLFDHTVRALRECACANKEKGSTALVAIGNATCIACRLYSILMEAWFCFLLETRGGRKRDKSYFRNSASLTEDFV